MTQAAPIGGDIGQLDESCGVAPQVCDARGEGAHGASTALHPFQLLERAIGAGTSPDVIMKLMDAQERFEAGQALKDFNNAMAAAKQAIPNIIKGKQGHGYKYEGLDDIARTIRPILARHGLSYDWETENDNNRIKVTCCLSHRNGHVKRTSLVAPQGCVSTKLQNPIQAMGSVITYLQRYTLKAALGLSASVDDDAAILTKTAARQAPISEQQLMELRSLIEDTGSDIERFCAHFRIAAVPDLPASRFGEAVASLKAKQKRAAEAAPQVKVSDKSSEGVQDIDAGTGEILS